MRACLLRIKILVIAQCINRYRVFFFTNTCSKDVHRTSTKDAIFLNLSVNTCFVLQHFRNIYVQQLIILVQNIDFTLLLLISIKLAKICTKINNLKEAVIVVLQKLTLNMMSSCFSISRSSTRNVLNALSKSNSLFIRVLQCKPVQYTWCIFSQKLGVYMYICMLADAILIVKCYCITLCCNVYYLPLVKCYE